MSELIRYIGIGLILLSALAVSRWYERFIRRRIAEDEGFSALLLHIRAGVECFLSSAEELLRGFENEALMNAGYLGGDGADICERFRRSSERLCISDKVRGILRDFFDSFGKEYKSGTVALIDRTRAALDEHIKAERESAEKDVKLVRTVLLSAALGAVILLI
ncbi:MAG: hypothetical protein IJX92_06755 [Clostridia bacterium]|nr:hypothetical protein [Clostridia bacterium]